MKKLSIINENIFDGIGRRSKGCVKRKEDEIRQVNLGLPSGTIWAACNLGASSPDEYGYYYSWGETEPKDKYYRNTYKFETRNNFTKYNEEDGKTILDLEDDAANVVLGGKWHIPTKKQIEELVENTNNEDSELDGVKGKLFTSKINGNTLFFPYSGYKSGVDIIGKGKITCCLSSSLYEHSYNYSNVLFSNSDKSKFDISSRCNGHPVRGVWNK